MAEQIIIESKQFLSFSFAAYVYFNRSLLTMPH